MVGENSIRGVERRLDASRRGREDLPEPGLHLDGVGACEDERLPATEREVSGENLRATEDTLHVADEELVVLKRHRDRTSRHRLDTPLLHGALVGFCAYVVIAILSTLINVAAGHGVPRIQFLIFNGFMLTVAGVFGGWAASARGSGESRPT